MKTKLVFVLALVLGAFLSGCNSSANLNKIEIGMTKDEVVALLGQPDSKSAQANVEYLTYYLYADGAFNGYGRDQPDMVRLVDGKVESFGRFAQLFDLYNRPITAARPGDANFPSPGMATITVQPSKHAVDYAAELERLQSLKDKGIITQAEFDQLKQKIVSQN